METRNPMRVGLGRCRRSSHSQGFSLIELLVTLALILVMATILMSRGSRSYQAKQLATCAKNLQTIYIAMNMYATDYKGMFPNIPRAETSEEPLSLLIPKYTVVTESFICPGSKDMKLPEGESFAKRKISYCYYMGWKKGAGSTAPLLSDRQVDAARKPKGEAVFSPDGEAPGQNHDKYGGNILFADGSTQMTGPKTEYELLYPSNIVFLNPKP